jgi:hypothetical protein
MKTESASRPYNRKTKAKAAARKKLKKRADKEYNRKDSKIGEGDIYTGIYEGGEYADSSSQGSRELRKLLDEAEAGRVKKYKGGGAVKPDFLDLDGDGNTSEPMKKAAKRMAKGGAVSTETDGVMQEHYRQPVTAPMKDENSGFSRGGGAALRGTKFRGVR